MRGRQVVLRDFLKVFFLGALGFSVQAGLFFSSVRYLDVSLAGLLLYLYPAFVVLFGKMFHQKPSTQRQFWAVAMSLLGGFFALRPTGGNVSVTGVLFGIGCALWYSNYLLVSERILRKVDSFLATASLSLGAAVVFCAASLVYGDFRIPAATREWLLLAGVAVLATVLPILTLFAAIRKIGAAKASLVSSFEIIPTVIAGSLIMGDKLHWVQWIGAVCIILAVVIIQSEESGATRS
jgi:drug/metabolite transporter (DMT)-like permease